MKNILGFTKIILLITIIIPAMLVAQKKQIMEKNETTVSYTIHGNGDKKVIVLHSWMGDYESWNPTIPYLDLANYTYVFMDVRGYGKSKDIRGKYTSDEIANDIFNLADGIGFDKFYIVGHSMTGMAVQKAALLDKSDRIIKVVAVTPVSSGGFPVDENNRNFFESIIQNYEMAKVAFGAFTSNRLLDKWKSISAKRHLEVTDANAQMTYIDMWTGENFSDKMTAVKMPFLVITGQYDHPGFILDAQKKAFSQFQQVEFLEIENSGHFPMQETPIFLASSIENFISKD